MMNNRKWTEGRFSALDVFDNDKDMPRLSRMPDSLRLAYAKKAQMIADGFIRRMMVKKGVAK